MCWTQARHARPSGFPRHANLKHFSPFATLFGLNACLGISLQIVRNIKSALQEKMAPRQATGTPAAAHGQHHVGDYVKPALETAVVKEEDISFLGDHHADKPLLQRLNFLHVFILFGVPALAIYGLATWEWNSMTAVFSVFYYFFTGLGITAGMC